MLVRTSIFTKNFVNRVDKREKYTFVDQTKPEKNSFTVYAYADKNFHSRQMQVNETNASCCDFEVEQIIGLIVNVLSL